MPTDPPFEAIVTSMSGTVSFQSEHAFPFLKEVVETLDEAGIPELDASHGFSTPPWWRDGASQPTAFLDPVGLGISLVLFSRTPVGEWAIDRFCDTVWEKAAKPAVRRLFGRPAGDGAASTVRLRVGTWFEEDKLFVEVVADVRSPDDAHALEAACPAGVPTRRLTTRRATHPTSGPHVSDPRRQARSRANRKRPPRRLKRVVRPNGMLGGHTTRP